MNKTLKERLQEIYSNLHDRVRSPFIISFILVWCIHNWDLIFYIFTFDDKMSFTYKYAKFKAYITTYGPYHLLWFPLIWAYVSIGMYIGTSFLAEGITLLYNKWARPFLYNLIDDNKIVRKDEYDRQKGKVNRLSAQLSGAKEDASDALDKLKQVEGELSKVTALRDQVQNQYSLGQKLINEKDGTIAKLQSEKDNLLERLEILEKEANSLHLESRDFESELKKEKEKNADLIKHLRKAELNGLLSDKLETTKTEAELEAALAHIRWIQAKKKFEEIFLSAQRWTNDYGVGIEDFTVDKLTGSKSSEDAYVFNIVGGNKKLLISDIHVLGSTLRFTKMNSKTKQVFYNIIEMPKGDFDSVIAEEDGKKITYRKKRP